MRRLVLLLLPISACEPGLAEEQLAACSGAGGSPTDDCWAQAAAQMEPLRSAGTLSASELERQYEVYLALCASDGVDPDYARLVGRVNFEYKQLALQLVAGCGDGASDPARMPQERYLALVRDRTRKKELGLDPAWSKPFGNGDRDEDLVPDELDDCPETPPLSTTDDRGCQTQDYAEVGGDMLELCAFFEGQHVFADPACRDAPVPRQPVPLGLGGDVPYGQTLIEVSAVDNQPAGCPVLVDIEGSYTVQNTWCSPTTCYSSVTSMPLHVQVWDRDQLDPGGRRLLFRAPLNQGTVIASPGQLTEVRWRARAMNGNGTRSPWSDVQTVTTFDLTVP